MRQNPSFAMTDVAEIRRLIARNPWTTLVSATDDGLVASHYAVLLDDEREDLTIVGHVGKPDDAIHGLGEREMMVVVQGPHGYVSPAWYGDVAAVPTWNFVSAHLT
ncbi:MAG: FMN-binding negative transcriptional regulator, partial [Microbacterium sp.]|nr:FMN-binding negative transcriptional regulator [Microbacterium sp.]